MTSGYPIQQSRPHDPSRASLEVHYRADGELSPGSIHDLGMGRLQLTGDVHFPAGTELELCFGHSSGRASGIVKMKASVQHAQAGKMAIAFVSVRPSDQAKTLGTIRQLTSSLRK